ncbi:MAG TPA: 3-isopropylmalate dehydrogenase [Pyrinomonadaceae bacterium]
MSFRITILPGDGIGPEVTGEAVRVLKTVATIGGYSFEFDEQPIGGNAIRSHGSPLPRITLDSCLSSDAVLLGAVGSPEYDHLPAQQRPEAGLLLLRRALGGFANLRPAMCYDAIASCSAIRSEISSGADILIVRELLGGLYFGEPRGFSGSNGTSSATNTMQYSVSEIERVAEVAFEAARKRRRKVTSVDKANVLETSQLWRQTVSCVGAKYKDVELEHLYVDACAMHLITNPRRFDVLLTENLFGDILSDEAAVLTGSLGMLPSASLGGEVGLYEPVHGSAPDIAGKGVANPFGAIASVAMMLRYSAQLEQEAADIEAAIESVLAAGFRTPDIAGDGRGFMASTTEIGDMVCAAVAEIADARHAYHAV